MDYIQNQRLLCRSEQIIEKYAELFKTLAAFISRRISTQTTILLIEICPFFLAEPCSYVTFWNHAGVPFLLYSSLKPEGYLVKGRKLQLRYVIRSGKAVKRSLDTDYDAKYLSQVKGA